jgi:hypothetical protein
MTQQTKTPLFNAAEHDPVRPGIYLVQRWEGEFWWRAFNGKDWFAGVRAGRDWYWNPSPSYEEMMKRRNLGFYKINGRQFEWCGLTKV